MTYPVDCSLCLVADSVPCVEGKPDPYVRVLLQNASNRLCGLVAELVAREIQQLDVRVVVQALANGENVFLIHLFIGQIDL